MKNLISNYKTSAGKPILERVDLEKYSELEYRFLNNKNIIIPRKEKLKRIGMNSDELHILHSHFNVEFCYKEKLYIFNMFPGFIFDKASVPKYLRSIVDNDDPVVEVAAMCHDPMFALHLLGNSDIGYDLANKIFYWIIYTVISNKADALKKRYDVKLSNYNELLKTYREVKKTVKRSERKKLKHNIKIEKQNLNRLWHSYKYLKLKLKLTPKMYYVGVSSPVGKKIYKANNPDTHWLKGFVNFSVE